LKETHVNNNNQLNDSDVSVKMVNPTEQAVDQAKAEISALPIREREATEILNKDVLETIGAKHVRAKRKISKQFEGGFDAKRKKTIWR